MIMGPKKNAGLYQDYADFSESYDRALQARNGGYDASGTYNVTRTGDYLNRNDIQDDLSYNASPEAKGSRSKFQGPDIPFERQGPRFRG